MNSGPLLGNAKPIGFIDRRAQLVALSILLFGLLIRLPFSAIDFGKTNDISVYAQWAEQIQTQGLIAVYEPGSQVNYPPMFLYWLAAADLLHPTDATLVALIKLPSVVADVLTGAIMLALVWKRSRPAAVLVGAVYLFNPAIWYVSAYWGQTDALYTGFLVGALGLLARGRCTWAWIVFSLALMTKIQSLAILPLFVMATVSRRSKIELARGGLAALLTILLITIPWWLNGKVPNMIQSWFAVANATSRVDVSAYNLWYLVLGGQVQAVAATEHPFNLPVSYRLLGFGLYGAFLLLAALLIWRSRARSIFLAGAILSLGLFVLFIDIHERYLFPAIALSLLAAVNDPRLRLVYGLLSLTFLFNLITIAPFTSALGSNLVAAPIDSPLVLALKILSLGMAALNVLILITLMLRLKRTPATFEYGE
jgi:Gpi18-like mannosyltransferase